MLTPPLTLRLLTASADTASSSTDDEVVFGGPGNDLLSNTSTAAPFLEGGQGNDTFQTSFNGFTIILDTAGANDQYIDPAVLPAGTGFVAAIIIEDGPRTHVSVVNAAGSGVLIVDALDENGAASIETIVVGEALSMILPGNPAIGTVLDFNTFFSQLSSSPLTVTATFSEVFGPAAVTLSDALQSIRDTAAEINNSNSTDGNDVITGTAQDNFLVGFEGDDTFVATAGNDIIDGGSGTDTYSLAGLSEGVTFTRNFDEIITVSGTETGTDTLENIEMFVGSDGDDVITDDEAFDSLEFIDGGAGDDSISVFMGGTAFGNDGDDNLFALDGGVTFFGGAGDDILTGGMSSGGSILMGGEGNDLLISNIADSGSTLGHSLFGGTGDDTYIIDSIFDTIGENADEGNDTIESSVSFSLINQTLNIENLELTGEDGLFGIGNDDANLLTGNSGDNLLAGLAGDDTINGGAGADALFGEAGDDTLSGGEGGDFLSGGIGADTLNGEAGIDLLAGGDGDDTLNGGAEGDLLFGEAGADTLNGGDGVDILFGEDNDLSALNAGGDELNGGNGGDLLFGGAGNDVLNGDDGDDVIFGGDDDDVLTGGAGQDFLVGDGGSDTFVFNTGQGFDGVLDFEDGIDLLDFSAFGFESEMDVLSSALEDGVGVFFDFGNGDSTIIFGTTIAELAGDIIV